MGGGGGGGGELPPGRASPRSPREPVGAGASEGSPARGSRPASQAHLGYECSLIAL